MFENILVEQRGKVGLITLNRPKQLNALSEALMEELGKALSDMDHDDGIGCMILTGSDKAFAAGADIAVMAQWTGAEAFSKNYLTHTWEPIRCIRKPIIAAVAGYALGGGCELALMCDFIIAATSAKFGQPEIKLGIIPGAGGSQRLPRAIGKAKAMDMILTGRMMDAAEAERSGLIARLVDPEQLLQEAFTAAEMISGYSQPMVMMAKEAVNRAYETSLTEGLLYERRAFHSTFAFEDQKEGMQAFLDKRLPSFKNK